MGQFATTFIVPEEDAISNNTNPDKANWITAHAIATELSIAEVERLWLRFQQLGCNKDGAVTEDMLKSSPHQNDVFVRNILRKFMSASTRMITFENFLRALKWCETSDLEAKLRGTFRLLNNGSPVTKDLLTKILERVYVDEKADNVKRVANAFFSQMDQGNKGQIDEDMFVRGVMKIPPETLESVLDFQILPTHMKEKLHRSLPEFSRNTGFMTSMSLGVTPQLQTPGPAKPIPSDEMLREVAEKIHKRDWDRVANKLEFLTEDINKFRDIYKSSTFQQVYQMLVTWKGRYGREAYSEILETALRQCGMHDASLLLSP